MRIGSSLVLIAIGAILKFAVTTSVSGISLSTVGVVHGGGDRRPGHLARFGQHRPAHGRCASHDKRGLCGSAAG